MPGDASRGPHTPRRDFTETQAYLTVFAVLMELFKKPSEGLSLSECFDCVRTLKLFRHGMHIHVCNSYTDLLRGGIVSNGGRVCSYREQAAENVRFVLKSV